PILVACAIFTRAEFCHAKGVHWLLVDDPTRELHTVHHRAAVFFVVQEVRHDSGLHIDIRRHGMDRTARPGPQLRYPQRHAGKMVELALGSIGVTCMHKEKLYVWPIKLWARPQKRMVQTRAIG